MGPASIILLMISAWFLVAAAMLWGMLRIARRHSAYSRPRAVMPPPAAIPTRRKAPRPKLPRPVLSPAYRAAHHFAHR
ncbi:hypothetical protein IB232_09065 [Pseudomonas sp. PDM15]|uniref:hypothetical protein n=1 Tax=Pseudomonas sp. PDM15 TaxID=2769303 RepID=UPI001786DEEB|nr:hypothetical protein [Pseudomonas sp. PDM15]MBD9425466.1 hypothetical protein [Pseudomonas sp. PDM15]